MSSFRHGWALTGESCRALRGALIAAGLVVFGLSMLAAGAMRQLFAVALYHYARDGQAIGGFSEADLDGAVRARGPRAALRTA